MIRDSVESPRFNSITSRKSSTNPQNSKDEPLDFATSQYNYKGPNLFNKVRPMYSFDGENSSDLRSKESSMNTTSKKSSENSLIR